MADPPRMVVLDGHTLAPASPAVPAKPGSADAPPPPAGEPSWVGLAELGSLTVHARTPADRVLDRARGAAIVLTNKTPLDAQTIAALPGLRYIGVLATGTDVVDLAAARDAGVTVTNAPGYSTDSVAQHTFAMLLELVSKPAAHDRAVQAGRWSAGPDFSFTVGPLTELAGLTLGIVGLGAIGRRVAAIGAALGMRIAAAHQRSMDRVAVPGIAVDWMDHDALFAAADVVTLHCPLTPETRGLVDARRLSRMKRGAILLNTGRGQLIDEAALAEALGSGRLGGAGLDVLSAEPPPADHSLLGLPNCLVTPHIAWASRAARRRLMGIVTENVRAFLAGAPVNVVTP